MEFEQAREYVIAEIANIKAVAGDDERAHSQEDALHLWVLNWAAERATNLGDARALARLAASTEDIDFSRWYA